MFFATLGQANLEYCISLCKMNIGTRTRHCDTVFQMGHIYLYLKCCAISWRIDDAHLSTPITTIQRRGSLAIGNFTSVRSVKRSAPSFRWAVTLRSMYILYIVQCMDGLTSRSNTWGLSWAWSFFTGAGVELSTPEFRAILVSMLLTWIWQDSINRPTNILCYSNLHFSVLTAFNFFCSKISAPSVFTTTEPGGHSRLTSMSKIGGKLPKIRWRERRVASFLKIMLFTTSTSVKLQDIGYRCRAFQSGVLLESIGNREGSFTSGGWETTCRHFRYRRHVILIV